MGDGVEHGERQYDDLTEEEKRIYEDSKTVEIQLDHSVNHPDYYRKRSGIEVIQAIEAWDLGFCLGNAVKYIARAGRKDSETTKKDLNKAIWYIKRYIEKTPEYQRGD